MQLNLKTVHKPASLDAAVEFLQTPGTFPLYGGAALQRSARKDVEAVLDLSQLDLAYVTESEHSLRLGSMLTLEQVREACLERSTNAPKLGALAAIIEEELPETLRNTFTLGDLLMERNPQSLTLTLLLALGAVIKRVDVQMHFTVAAWLGLPNDVSRYLIGQVRITRGPARAAIAYEKVARTPADQPVVGAVVYLTPSDESGARFMALALCGVSQTPVPQPNVAQVFAETGDLDQALDNLVLAPQGDHWGSAEYRAEMARTLSRRVILRAMEQAR